MHASTPTAISKHVKIIIHNMVKTCRIRGRTEAEWNSFFIVLLFSFCTFSVFLQRAVKYRYKERTCWITQDVIISALVPPLGVVILINAVILGMVIRVLIHPSSIRNRERDVVREVKSSLKASITLLPLLGLCWIFGFLQLNRDTLVFSYIFVILNASQGFCFLIFHCLHSNEVKTAWTKRSRTLRRSEYQSHHSSSSTPVRVHNSTSLQDVSFLSLSTLISRDESLTGIHHQNCSQGIQFKTEGENPGVRNIHSPKIFGPRDFDGAVLLRDLKHNVQLKEVKPRNTSNM